MVGKVINLKTNAMYALKEVQIDTESHEVEIFRNLRYKNIVRYIKHDIIGDHVYICKYWSIIYICMRFFVLKEYEFWARNVP